MDRWISVRTPAGRLMWNVGEPELTVLEDLLTRARIVAGLPPGDGEPGDVSIHDGNLEDLHADVFAQATVRDVAELRAVTAKAMRSRRDADHQARAHMRTSHARDALAGMTPQERQALLAELADGADATVSPPSSGRTP
jgi:fumarylacetoacetate (FAA) hydrolase family protein